MTQTRRFAVLALAWLGRDGYRNRVGLPFLALLLAPLLELWLLIRIGRGIGALPLLTLLLCSALLGIFVVRLKGRRVMEQAQATLARGEVPEDDIFSSMLVMLGGILLILPGVLSDVLGLLLLLPWTRSALMGIARKTLARRTGGFSQVHVSHVDVQSFGFGFPPSGPANPGESHRPGRAQRAAEPESDVSRAPTTVGYGPGRATVIVETEGEEVTRD